MFDITQALQKLESSRAGMPLVMGVLNVTPDSFSDGGQFVVMDAIKQQVEAMIKAGVDIIDIGGESTRPGAKKLALDIELQRVMPVIEWIKQNHDIALSIDTYKAEVMKQAIQAGVDIVNDVNALQAEGALGVVANSDVSVCLMHKQGTPDTMQNSPHYDDVVVEVSDFLMQRAQVCEKAGIAKQRIILDPGFGFGKDLQHNTQLFNDLDQMLLLGYPLLVGVSRKRMIGQILASKEADLPVEQRMVGSVSAAVLAGLKGAQIVRVHDVEQTVQALRTVSVLI